MALRGEIESLLREVGRVRSPVGRMKILARAWRTVRDLTADERKEVVARLGLEEFEVILRRLGRKGGSRIPPTELAMALDAVDDVDPSKVRELVGDLRDPRRRKDLLRRGLEALRERLEEPADDRAAAEPAPEEAPAPETVAEEPDRPPRPVLVETPAESAGGPVEVAPEPETPVREPAPAPPAAAVTAPEAPPAGPGPDEPAPASGPPVPAPPTEATPARDPLREIRREASLTARFRALRGLLARGESLDRAEVVSLLALFPEGWARRRVLAAVLREGCPEDPDEAIALVGELPRASDRRWCARALARSRDLGPERVSRLEETVGPAPGRRGRRADAAAR